MAKLNIGEEGILKDGSVVEVAAVNGGWTTYITKDGIQKKCRNGDIKAKDDDASARSPAPRTGKEIADEENWDRTAGRNQEIDGDLDAEEADEEVRKRLINPDYGKYTTHEGHLTQSGRKVIDRDDDVAAEIRDMDLDKLYGHVAAKMVSAGDVEVTADSLMERYQHLNRGMQRMNLGNRLRGAYSRIEKSEEKAQDGADE